MVMVSALVETIRPKNLARQTRGWDFWNCPQLSCMQSIAGNSVSNPLCTYPHSLSYQPIRGQPQAQKMQWTICRDTWCLLGVFLAQRQSWFPHEKRALLPTKRKETNEWLTARYLWRLQSSPRGLVDEDEICNFETCVRSGTNSTTGLRCKIWPKQGACLEARMNGSCIVNIDKNALLAYRFAMRWKRHRQQFELRHQNGNWVTNLSACFVNANALLLPISMRWHQPTLPNTNDSKSFGIWLLTFPFPCIGMEIGG